MTNVKEIEKAIEQLSDNELATFRESFDSFDNEKWDKQIERDIDAGKLDTFAKKAISAFRAGKYKEI
jgi:hypothetical protein